MTNPEISVYHRPRFPSSHNINHSSDYYKDNQNNENKKCSLSQYPRWPPLTSSSTQSAPRRPQCPLANNYKNNINIYNLIKEIVNNFNNKNDYNDNYLNNLFNNLDNLFNNLDSDYCNNLYDSDLDNFNNLFELINIIKNCIITINIRENKIIKLQEQIINIKKEINKLYRINSNYYTVEKNKCCVCLEQPSNFANNVCGHLCLCSNCVSQIEKCPICRQEGLFIKIISS